MSLPSGYTQLEYIQTALSSTYSIDTNIIAQETDKIIVDANIDTYSASGDKYLTAASNSWIDIANGGNSWFIRFGSSGSLQASTSGDLGQRNIYELYKQHFDINGTTKATPNYSSMSDSWKIFGPSSSTRAVPCKMYSYKIINTNTNEVRFNGVPCKNSLNILGMYDLVSNTFFTNAGTGTFIAGPEVITQVVQEIQKEYVVVDTPILPSGYTQLEYIQSSGTQWIDTGISPAGKKIGAVIDFQFTSTSRTTGGVFGSNKTDGTDNIQFTVYTSKWRIKINSYAVYGVTYDTSRHIVRCNMPDGTSLDSTVYTTTQYTVASSNTYNVLVGACKYGTGISGDYSLVGKLYSAKVYDNTTLVRDFIPAKNSSNVVGMYDLVSNTFFTNAGTGSFTAGAEVQIQEVIEIQKEYVVNRTENLFDVDETAVGSIAELQAITKPTKSRANVTTAGTIGNDMMWTANAKGIVIPCSKGDTFTLKIFGTITTRRKYYNECDADGKNLTTRSAYSDSYEKTIITTQDNCAYLFIEWSIDTEDNAEVVVVKGSTAPTEYLPYLQINEIQKQYVLYDN